MDCALVQQRHIETDKEIFGMEYGLVRVPVLASDEDFQHPNSAAEQLTRSSGLSTHINHTQH